VMARARLGAVLVLSHDCDLDKGKKRVVVAPVNPVANLAKHERESVLAQRSHSSLVLPDVPSLGACYADLRLTTAVDRAFLDIDKRIASLSEAGLGRLRLQLIGFFTRRDMSRDLEALSKRTK